jgi:putative hemolysin
MLYFEIAVIVLLIVVNGLLAMSELAIVSSRPARLKVLIDQNVRGSRRALALASDPGRFLSTVQIGITLVGILSGAFSGATLGARFSMWLESLGLPEASASALGFGSIVVVITYASLIAGELVPKQIALKAPEAIAVRVAPPMLMLARIASPIVWLLDKSGKFALRLLGQREESETRVTEEEIKTLIAEAETAGVLEPGERQMIAGVLRLGDRPVRAVMTPRHDVDMIDLSDDPALIHQTIIDSVHSRLPVSEGAADHVIGIIQAKDLLRAYMKGEDVSPRRFTQPAPIIPETADALDVLQILKSSPVHVGLVHDEYGSFQGVVTATDILEAIAGTFRTEEGHPEPNVTRLDDGSYLISGSMPADEFAEVMRIRLPEGRTYHTVAGFMLDKFGHVPETGAGFTAHGWRFEVVDLDGRRIDKIRARRATPIRRAS